MLFLKGDSNSKHFSFYFNVLNKISTTPHQLLNFQELYNLPLPPAPFFQPPLLLNFEEFGFKGFIILYKDYYQEHSFFIFCKRYSFVIR